VARGIPNRRRVKVSVTISPEILRAVDAFVSQHPDTDRSNVVEDALECWYAQQLDLAMEQQFRSQVPASAVEERAGWRRIQDAAAARVFHRNED
jgi:metal-responsive CopG/Arc/MetJ family transcriptional regulator